MSTNKKLIDIHSHIIFGVDDGAESLEMSLEMLEMMVAQGVSDVIATPHIQSSVTRTSRETQIKQFNILKEAASKLDINLYLGAEVRYRAHLNTEYELYRLNDTKYILVEFNPHQEEPIEDVLYNLVKKNFKVILAHCERYPYLSLDDYYKLKEMGVLLQVNADSAMGNTTKLEYKTIKKLLNLELVDFVATDTHKSYRRYPNLGDCYKLLLNKKYEKSYLDKIFYENASLIISKGE